MKDMVAQISNTWVFKHYAISKNNEIYKFMNKHDLIHMVMSVDSCKSFHDHSDLQCASDDNESAQKLHEKIGHSP